MKAQDIPIEAVGNPISRYVAMCLTLTPAHIEGLQRLDYRQFLHTPYWRIVTDYVRYGNDTCWRCGFTPVIPGQKTDFNVHHRTYRRHGLEHLFWAEDLEVLCRTCHELEHKRIQYADSLRARKGMREATGPMVEVFTAMNRIMSSFLEEETVQMPTPRRDT